MAAISVSVTARPSAGFGHNRGSSRRSTGRAVLPGEPLGQQARPPLAIPDPPRRDRRACRHDEQRMSAAARAGRQRLEARSSAGRVPAARVGPVASERMSASRDGMRRRRDGRPAVVLLLPAARRGGRRACEGPGDRRIDRAGPEDGLRTSQSWRQTPLAVLKPAPPRRLIQPRSRVFPIPALPLGGHVAAARRRRVAPASARQTGRRGRRHRDDRSDRDTAPVWECSRVRRQSNDACPAPPCVLWVGRRGCSGASWSRKILRRESIIACA